MLFVKTSNREPPDINDINNRSTTIISNKISDHRLNETLQILHIVIFTVFEL
jgi:hypothetical protein